LGSQNRLTDEALRAETLRRVLVKPKRRITLKTVYIVFIGDEVMGAYESKERAEKIKTYLDNPYARIIETTLN